MEGSRNRTGRSNIFLYFSADRGCEDWLCNAHVHVTDQFAKSIQARVNIPALSARTIERDIAMSSFSIKAGVQVRS